MVTAYRITDWSEHYETAESRRIKDLSWIATPNGHDSVSYCKLLRHPNGMAHFGAWNLILQVASKCSTRGTLTYGKKCLCAHSAEIIAELTHSSVAIIREAISRLLELGWLEEIDLPAQPTAGHAQPTAGQATNTGQDRTGHNRTGQDSGDALAPLDEKSDQDKRQRDFLEALGAKTRKKDEDLLPEWKSAVKELKTDYITLIFKEAKPGILWPSEFKAQRLARRNA